MSPIALMILLLVLGAILLAAELFLPAGGVIGVLGAAAILGAVGVGFWVNQWLGLGLTLAVLVAAPFVATGAINLWPKTPYGKKVVLSPEESRIVAPRIVPGQAGVALTELRPAGEVRTDDGSRIEARSERGIIRAGSTVSIVGVIDGVVVVREASNTST
jgi:membrane-bound ClpP family serine protease